MMTAADPIELELLRDALESIVDEMALTMIRTAHSQTLKSAVDMSTALCTPEGELLAQSMTLPLHLLSIPPALGAVLRTFGDDVKPGDVFALNDPYDGGSHLPDVDPLPLLLHDDVLAVHECAHGALALHRDVDGVAIAALVEAGEVQRRFAQGLGGDRAGVDARAAEDRLALDEGDALAEVRRLRRSLFTCRTGADDDQVVHVSSGSVSGAGRRAFCGR